MKHSTLGMKILMVLVTVAVLFYFGIQMANYFTDPLSTTLAYEYQVEEGLSLSGYVVRSERVLPDDTSGLLQPQRAEGERVSAGGTVALVYADQASLDRQDEIDALEIQLQQLQYAQEASLGSEAALRLDAQIMQRIFSARGALAAGRLDQAEEQTDDLKSLVLRRDYTYSDTTDLDARIQEVEAQLKTLRAQAASSIRRITAPEAGLYSAEVDGYETVLTPDILADLTPSTLSAVKADESVTSSVGKLVLGDSWYYVASMDAETAAELQEEGSLSLRFSKGVTQALSVSIASVGPEENGRVVVAFEGRRYLSELTLLRQQRAEVIHSTVSGIRIPKEALRAQKVTVDSDGNRETEDVTGVYCVVGAEARFKPVQVLYTGDDFVLVESTVPVSTSTTASMESTRLRAGDQVIISAYDLYDGKVIT